MITSKTASLDRTLTNALIGNFKDLASSDREAITSAIIRLKGQELRLQTQIRNRERAGGVLKTNLAREDRARLKIVRNLLEQLQAFLGG